ncbi:major histocompatibility complex class I-related gene protein-like [Polyodon spathula]|uniref:major histocompatibility complex class I-related gene protein-like n=1 Tax=Polyodon spathula TaxID=7913 RepID=UPI001B7DC883|nr:major histocompatibility complex class I-related gene protein-like [Polyodon spathula]
MAVLWLVMHYEALASILIAHILVTSASVGTHSLRYCFTATSTEKWFQESVLIGMVNDEQLEYYDRGRKQVVLRTNCMNKSESQQDWTRHNMHAEEQYEWMKISLINMMFQFKHTRGIHVLQRMISCELDEDGTARRYMQDVYDGKNYITFDDETETWTASLPQALYHKRKWEADPNWKAYILHLFQQECIDWLKKYTLRAKKMLERKVPPEVRLLQKKSHPHAGSEVICHVTGFYPRDVNVSWLRDGQGPLEEGVWSGEVLPNMDGTYQVRKTLTVSPEEQARHRYTCQVEHASLGEKIKKEWGTGSHTGIIFGVVVSALLLITVVIAGVVIFKMRQAGAKTLDYKAAQTTESDASSRSSSNS